jgi:hypothetical protein
VIEFAQLMPFNRSRAEPKSKAKAQGQCRKVRVWIDIIVIIGLLAWIMLIG